MFTRSGTGIQQVNKLRHTKAIVQPISPGLPPDGGIMNTLVVKKSNEVGLQSFQRLCRLSRQGSAEAKVYIQQLLREGSEVPRTLSCVGAGLYV